MVCLPFQAGFYRKKQRSRRIFRNTLSFPRFAVSKTLRQKRNKRRHPGKPGRKR